MENPSAPVVETRQGALIGFTEGDTHVWCGIPYAAPPVGQWRWRSPRPPARWDGVRPATAFSASSWQSSESCQELGGGDPGQFSEDCLYLNVWSPVAPPPLFFTTYAAAEEGRVDIWGRPIP